MKKNLNEIFDEASPRELELFAGELNSPELSPQALDSIKNKVYEKTNLNKGNKRPKGVWLQIGVVAASFLLIVGAVFALPSLREDDPGILPLPDVDVTTASDATTAEPESPSAPATESVPELDGQTKAPSADPEYPLEPDTNSAPGSGEQTEAPVADPESPSAQATEPAPGSGAQTEVPPVEPESPPAPSTDLFPEPDTQIEVPSVEPETPSAPSTEIVPDFGFFATISDPRFENYELSGNYCNPEIVGDLLGDIIIKTSCGPENIAEVRADVYSVSETDRGLCLCIRYIDDGTNDFYSNFLDYDVYYFLYSKFYRFASLDDMRDAVLENDAILIPNYLNYFNTTEVSYFFNDAVVAEFNQLFLSVDGDAVAQDSITLESIKANAKERVSSSCRFEGRIGYTAGGFHIYDNGYLYYSPFGGQLFNIGEAKAREIIDFVINKGTTKRYEWIESNGVMYPIIYDENAEYPDFLEMLNENKLYGQIYLEEKIIYWENCYGASHHELTLPRDALLEIAKIINDANGPAVKTDQIDGFTPEEMLFHPVESITFTDEWGTSISVYDCGHIEVNECYYFVGTAVTDKIIDIVHAALPSPVN